MFGVRNIYVGLYTPLKNMKSKRKYDKKNN